MDVVKWIFVGWFDFGLWRISPIKMRNWISIEERYVDVDELIVEYKC